MSPLKNLAFALPLAALLPSLGMAQNVSVNFDSASDLGSFNQVTGADAASTSFVQSAGSGTGGSGAAVFAASPVDTTAIYTGTSFDLSTTGTITLSVDFQTAATTGSTSANAIAMVGFVGATTTGFYSVNNATTGDNFIGGRIRHASGSGGANGLQSQTKLLNSNAVSSPADGSLANITFATSNWYRLSLEVTRTATANTFSYTLTLWDLGSAGTSTPAIMTNGTLSGNLVNADLYSDSSVYAAFRGVPGVAVGDVAFDNFTVTTVPEPSSYALVIGGFCLGLALLKRRRTA